MYIRNANAIPIYTHKTTVLCVVQADLYMNKDVPIVFYCGMKKYCLPTNYDIVLWVSYDSIPLPSMVCVSVPFSKLHEHACTYCFSCWYEGLFTNKLWECGKVHCCTKFHMCVNFWLVRVYTLHKHAPSIVL